MQASVSSISPTLEPDADALRRRFAAQGQEHVFAFWDRLGRAGARRLEPLPIRRLPEHGGPSEDLGAARALGEARLCDGRLGVLVVAGGQGTRLGFDSPKGALPVGPVTERSLFALQAQKLRGVARRYGRSLPWYVMTSPATDAATRARFRAQGCFGIDPSHVFFFPQRTVALLDFEGRLMLEAEHRIVDPTYLGLHVAAGAERSCKVIAKRDPMDRVGHVARVDGRPGVVEHTEIPPAERDARGELVLWAGSIAIHVFDVAFLRRCAAEAEGLFPWHASPKKIPCLGGDGRPAVPSEPKGWKLEPFVFDALPAAGSYLVVETRREDEYEPIKNARDAESPESARRALVSLYRRWLLEAGLEMPPDATIEIDHSRFDGPDDLRASGIQRIAEAGDAIRLAPGAMS